MPLTAGTKNALLDYLGTLITHVSAHTANPTSLGNFECTGSVRAAVTWGVAAGGIIVQTNSPLITNIDDADPVQFLGFWNAVSAGTYRGYNAVTPASSTGGIGTWSYEVYPGAIDLNYIASA